MCLGPLLAVRGGTASARREGNLISGTNVCIRDHLTRSSQTANGQFTTSADCNRLRSAEYWHSLLPGSMHDKPDIDQELPFYRKCGCRGQLDHDACWGE